MLKVFVVSESILINSVLCSPSLVGEPLNDEAWLWYNNVVGGGKCTVVDTWWQTGTFMYMYHIA